MTHLSIAKLSVRYGKRRVINGLDAPCLAAGEVTALLGPNGSGKSTLLRALAGLQPCEGQIALDGRPLDRRRGQAAYLPQTLPPCVHLTVFESLMVAGQATASGLFRRHGDDEVVALLESLGIVRLARSHLDQLSGGQRQLVGIAQALIREPALLLLDEPLSALDLNYQFHVMDLLRRETRRRRMVTLIVLHDLNAALRHADRALMLKDGRLLADGRPEQVIDAAALRAVYGVDGRVERCPQGVPHVLVDGLSAA
ncbi:ABC transporter ATP-binding protein [Chromobacterium alticapitis]|uniref:Iron ABC transporter ATP-binding protein n=1 Tax=Chromobacterium alticapitis TaxID=2073169 RepID=A0A2S5DH03_9NEIS|nr:ABC transporter ATP-binding protein [Chromobacterium alticapitis]POZ62365.1 iron ABC transporter ATP-binding protein [Chromobacterium alticapitis]